VRTSKGALLPRDERGAHGTSYPRDTPIGERGCEAIARWYAEDYELIEIADSLHEGRFGPSAAPAAD
jgi:hypothetical protein